ncbi:MAG: universal stress protein [Hyphomicrobiaceae bacterium]
MKTILIPTDQGEHMPAALETARLLANLFDATVEGVALRPAFAEIVAPDPLVAVTLPPADWNEAEFTRNARQIFDSFSSRHPISDGKGARFRWRGGPAIEDGQLASTARVFDITVLERPGRGGSRMTAFEAALFDTGRPILMAPPEPPTTLGDTVLIHWNASSETVRAMALSMPILKRARRVSFIAVEGSIVQGPSVKEALGYLEAHGIQATEKTVAGTSQKAGELILAEAKQIGADLLIKGAYTQSRLRQMIFGGATSHILSAATLPVFLSH